VVSEFTHRRSLALYVLVDVVVVNGVQLLRVLHLLQVHLHRLLAQVLLRVSLFVSPDDFLVLYVRPWQLVPQCDPAWLAVVRPPEEFYLLTARRHTLDQTVDLVGLSGGLAHFGD
jgi:hypothetical protein